MGYLEELRKARQARLFPPKPPEKPKSDLEILQERGERALWKAGVTEAITLFREEFRERYERLGSSLRVFTSTHTYLDKGIHIAHLSWYPNDVERIGSEFSVEKNVAVVVERWRFYSRG